VWVTAPAWEFPVDGGIRPEAPLQTSLAKRKKIRKTEKTNAVAIKSTLLIQLEIRVTLAGKTVINDLDLEYRKNTSFQREVDTAC
jgi:hypothetical protein